MIANLTDSLIRAKKIPEEDLSKVGWFVYAEGETEQYPFALLRAYRNNSGHAQLNREDLVAAKANYDFSVMANVPFYFQLMIMPLNFPEFWPLIHSID
jgi:hypothetical protein